jgi:hypothetical protein
MKKKTEHLTDSLFDNEAELSIPSNAAPALDLPTPRLIPDDKSKLDPVVSLSTPKMELAFTLSSDNKASNAGH